MCEQIFEEMEYMNTHKVELCKVLNFDEYKGYYYYILNLSIHPCAYVVLNKDDKLFGKSCDEIERLNVIYCHGGFTYSENTLYSKKYAYVSEHEDKWVIGWDYGHYKDWSGLYSDDMNKQLGNHKWTTSEIQIEVREVIDQIIEYNKRK